MALTDAGHITEFYKGFNGTCGECALEVAKAAARGQKANLDDMVTITHDMQNHNEASSNGASNVSGLADEARRQGLTVLTEWDYSEPFPHDWHALLLANAGKNPVILEFAQAHNLKDIETGAADEAGVDYHYICVLGAQPDGYVANDGDNYQVTSRFQVYSYADIASAVPCGLLMIEAQAQGATPPMAVPTGWTDTNGVIHAPGTNNTVTNAFAQYIRTNPWAADNIPLTDDTGMAQLEEGNPSLGGGDQQVFRRSVLEYTTHAGVFEMWTGQEILALRAAKGAADSAAAQAKAASAAKDAEIAKLQAELTIAQAVKPMDPSVASDLSAVVNLLAPFAAAAQAAADAQKKVSE